MTLIMDGNATSKAVQEKIAQDVEKLKSTGKRPGLAVVLVGEDPATHWATTPKNINCPRTPKKKTSWRSSVHSMLSRK